MINRRVPLAVALVATVAVYSGVAVLLHTNESGFRNFFLLIGITVLVLGGFAFLLFNALKKAANEAKKTVPTENNPLK
jgi:high-affinity Fe2+/Pb2+ permease